MVIIGFTFNRLIVFTYVKNLYVHCQKRTWIWLNSFSVIPAKPISHELHKIVYRWFGQSSIYCIRKKWNQNILWICICTCTKSCWAVRCVAMTKCLVKAAARFTIKNIAACKMLLLIIKVALGVCFALKSWKEYLLLLT